MNKLLITAAVLAFATPAFAQEENTIELTAVPQPAMDAAMANANGVTFDAAQIDNDEGTETYELSGKMANGMTLEVDVLADGTLEEIEEQIDAAALPSEVAAALEQNLPGFAPTFIEKSTRPDGTVIYEFEGTHEGKEIDAEINADGSNFVMADDAAA